MSVSWRTTPKETSADAEKKISITLPVTNPIISCRANTGRNAGTMTDNDATIAHSRIESSMTCTVSTTFNSAPNAIPPPSSIVPARNNRVFSNEATRRPDA